MSLRLTALGVALGQELAGVREVGGNNLGPMVSLYLRSVDPPIAVAAPWCAAFVQACADHAAKRLGVRDPLDDVKLEALVVSYYRWATAASLLVPAYRAEVGDLVLFDFGAGGNQWDHMGFVVRPPDATGSFLTIEGNTGSQSERDGDGAFVKTRTTRGGRYPTAFIHWSD